MPGFGHVDLELDLDGDEPQPHAASGVVDVASAQPEPGEEHVPPSTSRVFGGGAKCEEKRAANTRATLRRNVSAEDRVHDESTRIVHGDALSNITRPPPPLEARTTPQPPAPSDGHTRAWSAIDAEVLARSSRLPEDEDASRSSFTSNEARSESGVATRDGRVAAMRELYAKGDAAGALALGATLGHTSPPSGPDHDHPDASIVVEFGEEEISNPYGGLIPSDDLDDGSPRDAQTAAPPRLQPLQPLAPQALTAPQLSLTERHSIPRILKSASEVSKLPIDHRAGFLLAHVDGTQTLEEILDVCAMPSTEALDLIGKLKKMGVIEFE